MAGKTTESNGLNFSEETILGTLGDDIRLQNGGAINTSKYNANKKMVFYYL